MLNEESNRPNSKVGIAHIQTPDYSQVFLCLMEKIQWVSNQLVATLNGLSARANWLGVTAGLPSIASNSAAISGLRITALPSMTSMDAISVLSSRFFFAMGAGAVTSC